MTADLQTAARAFRKAKATLDTKRDDLHEAIRAAHAAGTIQADIARVTGYSRETIARITGTSSAS